MIGGIELKHCIGGLCILNCVCLLYRPLCHHAAVDKKDYFICLSGKKMCCLHLSILTCETAGGRNKYDVLA